MIAGDRHDQLVLALQGGLARFNPDDGSLNWLVEIEKDKPDNRTNDGGIDPSGRLWIGTMNLQFKKGAGSLYCVNTDLRVSKKLGDLTIPNGMVWSPDKKRLFHIDSPTNKVQSYLYDDETGGIVFEKTIIHIDKKMGDPDGMTIDESGMLWIAHWGGFGVYQWNPETGECIGKINVPAPHVSCCAFGGENLDKLYITTARQDMNEADLEKYPDSGSIFIADAGVKGIKKNLFGG